MIFFSYFSFQECYPVKLLLLYFLSSIVLPVSAELIFNDHFENIQQIEKNWNVQAIDWKLSPHYNRSPKGRTSLHLAPTQLGVWQQIWQTVNFSKPFHLRIWFYERGWDNRVKVDQQYLFIGNKKTFDNSNRKCQIGQSGHKNYEGFYVIFSGLQAHKSQSRANHERWVQLNFVIDSDGTAIIKIDDQIEITLQEKWETVGTIGLGVFGREDRGGSTDAYWDHLEIFDTVEIPNLAIDHKKYMTTTWSELKNNR